MLTGSNAAPSRSTANAGEAVAAYVVPMPGQRLTVDELRGWLEPRLARFKMPREIVLIEEPPRLGSGKVNRVQLNQRARTEFSLEAEVQ